MSRGTSVAVILAVVFALVIMFIASQLDNLQGLLGPSATVEPATVTETGPTPRDMLTVLLWLGAAAVAAGIIYAFFRGVGTSPTRAAGVTFLFGVLVYFAIIMGVLELPLDTWPDSTLSDAGQRLRGTTRDTPSQPVQVDLGPGESYGFKFSGKAGETLYPWPCQTTMYFANDKTGDGEPDTPWSLFTGSNVAGNMVRFQAPEERGATAYFLIVRGQNPNPFPQSPCNRVH
jgi:hypothetical protein